MKDSFTEKVEIILWLGISTSNRLQMTLLFKKEEKTFLTASGITRTKWTEITAGILEYLKEVSAILWVLYYSRETDELAWLISFGLLAMGEELIYS